MTQYQAEVILRFSVEASTPATAYDVVKEQMLLMQGSCALSDHFVYEWDDPKVILSVRQKEEVIVKAIIESALCRGYSISIFDGEEVAIAKSTDPEAILKKMFATDAEELIVYDHHCVRRGTAYLIYGNDGHDVISDHTLGLEAILRPVLELAQRLS